MSDELGFPEIPEARPDDLEDVSWALSTAEAMWARGDHADAIKWVRRAAEAASEAENDMRALELAKAAADLAGILTKQQRQSIDLEEVDPMSEPSPPPLPRKDRPSVPKPAPASVTKQVTTPSRPPAPLPSSRSQPPPSMSPKPLGTNTGRTNTPRSGKDGRRRRSRENIEPSELGWSTPADTGREPRGSDTNETPVARTESEPTLVGHVDNLARAWDSSPTANLIGDELPDGERRTAIAVVPEPGPRISAPPPTGTNPPITAVAAPARPPSIEPHDPAIQTSQAVRVVVWRDASGVHVAPAGTVVSAITVDAVLVALEPSADLTAWLSQKTR